MVEDYSPAWDLVFSRQPVSHPVEITRNDLTDDTICDKQNHGGPDQAIYVLGSTDYDWWSATLGRELAPGTFGENFTVSSLESARFSIGDRPGPMVGRAHR